MNAQQKLYSERKQSCERALEKLEMALRAKSFDSITWSDAAELGHLDEVLNQALFFATNGKEGREG